MISFPLQVVIKGIDELTAPAKAARREVEKMLRPLHEGMRDLRVHAKALASASGLDKVGKGFSHVMHQAAEVGHEFKHVALELAAGESLVTYGLFELVHAFGETGEEIKLTAKKFGLGTDTLQEWRYAAKRAHVETDVLDNALAKLSVNLGLARFGRGPALGALQMLGIRVFDAEHKVRSLSSVLPEIVDKLKALRDPGMRALYTFQLFGKSWKDLAPLLDLGSEKIGELGKKARELGLILTDEDLEAAERFENAWKDIKDTLLGIRNDIARELAPELTKLAEMVRDFFRAHRAEIRQFAHDFGEELPGAVRELTEDLKPLLKALGQFLQFLRWLSHEIGPLNTALLLFAVTIGRDLTMAVLGLIPALTKLSIELLSTPAGWVILAVSAIIVVYARLAMQLHELRTKWKLTWGEIVEGLVRVELQIAESLVPPDIKWAWDKFVGVLSAEWDLVVEIFTKAKALIVGLFDDFAHDPMHALFGDWVNLPDELAALWVKIKAPFDDGFAWIKDKVAAAESILPAWMRGQGVADVATAAAPAAGSATPASTEAPGPGRPPAASLRVDFSGMPRGVRVSTERVEGFDLDLRKGYTMVAQ